MKDIEHQIQAEAFKVIRLLGKQDQFYATIHAIPNGGKRSIGTAVKLKAEGVLAGIPDIFVPAARMYIEVKAPKGKLSIEQASFLKSAVNLHYHIAVCRAHDDILQALIEAKDMFRGGLVCPIRNRTSSALEECEKVISNHSKKNNQPGGTTE